MRRCRAWFVLALSSTGGLAACGFFIDPDKLVSGIDGGPVGADAGAADATIDPRCIGPEICDDGIDNNCDGKADCADPTCAPQYSCVDVPSGWSLIALAEATRPPCPAHYESPTDVRVIANLGHTCECDCASSCTSGTLSISTGAGGTCDVSSTTLAVNTNGVCTKMSTFDILTFSLLSAPSSTCTPKNVTTKSNVTSGRTCVPEKGGLEVTQKAGAGCAASEYCVPRSPGFSTCVIKAGADSCPPGFSKLRHMGSRADDTRTCAGCACSSSATCNAEVEVWSHPQCNGVPNSALSSATHGICSSSAPVDNARAYKSTTTGGCTVTSPSTPQGSISIEDEQTICCR